jgi:ubiquinone/menaquinone biosynthesis C-methylase UbiE
MTDRARQTGRSTDRLIAEGHVVGGGSPFALPVGIKGRLAGWYMGFSDAQHRELAEVAPIGNRSRLIEIGFGPGQLLAMLHARSSDLVLAGVDPSELMVRRARRRNSRADLHLGAAAAIPFPDGYADIVISVNNIPMWPDLDAGLAEIRRVLQPAGVAMIAWHGGHDPRGHQRRLVLGPERKAVYESAMQRVFPVMTARTLQHSDVWEVSGGVPREST